MPENNKEQTYQPMTFDAIKIGLASPEKILEWSKGEVTKPETINYRTLKPEKDGLFCEKIFGPSKDWECHCGKYKKIRYKGVVCDRCGVEVTKASVRRERMGHIALAAPVSHIWYFKGIPSRMGLILDLSPRTLEKVLYFASYIVLDKGESDLMYKQVLSEAEYQEAREKWGSTFRVGMGAESIKELLENIDLEKEYTELTEGLKGATGQKRARIVKRLEVVEAFRESGNKPEWMIMTNIPVIPPDLRPMVQLDGGRFATSDLNDLYRRIINRNNRLRRLLELGAPDIIVRNEKRMLQEAVDALIDNGRRGRPVTGPGNRALKSLSDMLKGKSGRFRQNLLGKRVDYSGRSVIVVGPELKIYQCGLPKEMAIELFKPFVMKELVQNGTAHNIKNAKKMVERLQPEVWDVLEEVIKEHPVMLNRAPTLHRLGIQAFEPILVEGKAIKLHPLVCTAFNADFDGDQMAVHLPLSVEAQAECRFLLLSPNNLLKPSDGGPVAVPSQDMVLGIYYLTQERPGAKGEGMIFKSFNEALLAYENAAVTLHSRVKVRVSKKMADGTVKTGTVESTVGRFMFNEIIPQDLGFVDRDVEGNELLLEVDFHVGKKQLKQILEKVINTHGATATAEVLDHVKAMGYKLSTRAAMTVSISDMTVPPQKPEMIKNAQDTVDKITKNFKRGLITEEERYKEVVETWKATDDALTKALLDGLDKYNNIFMMADSGARGSDKQIKQLAGMRGLMADTTGHTIELPIKSNFREGLDVLEYFMSAHGARKGMSDTALRTADSGYLTRRLVDVSQELIIHEVDCAKKDAPIPGIYVKAFMDGKEEIESLQERITGRYLCYDIVDKDGNVLASSEGTATITATTLDGGYTATCKVIVSAEPEKPGANVTGVSLNASSLSLNKGEEAVLAAVVSPSSAINKSVTWSSSDATVATVTNDGTVKAGIAGVATITVTTDEGGYTATCEVTVIDPDLEKPVVEVKDSTAILTFPKVPEATFYEVSVYKYVNEIPVLFGVYTVDAEGNILTGLMSELRSGEQEKIKVSIPELDGSSEYIVKVTAIKEGDGRQEILGTFYSEPFSTSGPVANEAIGVGEAMIYYYEGRLHLNNLEGYSCYIVNMNGAILDLFKISGINESHPIQYSRGAYIIVVVKDNDRMSKTIVVK